MIVMFTSPAYSAVHSNNLLSRYPEGWCRLKMSNLCFLLHGCGNAAPISQFQYDVVRPDTSCCTLLHPHQKIQKLLGKACQGRNMKVARGYVGSSSQQSRISQVIEGHDETHGRMLIKIELQ